jgi:hypothetical protein
MGADEGKQIEMEEKVADVVPVVEKRGLKPRIHLEG